MKQDTTEWFVLKGEHRFGPFTYPDLVRMLQEKIVFTFDYGWHTGLSGWKRLTDIAEFQESAIRTFLNEEASGVVFGARKHPRRPFLGRLIIHDQKQWWNGQAFEISEGGAGVIMENSMIVPGEHIHLHFKPFENIPPFNASGEVVSKKFIEQAKERSAPIQYNIKFLTISGADKDQLFRLLRGRAA